ncbi:MAG: L-arabinolactonase [Alphaproteobacteria bacterium MarineAlpha11_Bin1]|nr:MAG: L-arabinolactonase [Alphaproteobacteria bacterium MarineAlpha11_Bin1]|tara:strand:+ start:2597 stop:3475 length:879 start_codon:yes stop_codon:yes gene_type:complete
MSEPYVAVRQSCVLGESPIWSEVEQALYWVDIRNPMIFRWYPESKALQSWRVQTEIGSIGFAGDGRLIAGTRMGFAFINLADGEFHLLEDPEGEGRMNAVRMNDGKVDRSGRFWCGSMEDPGYGEVASLYRFDTDHTVHRMEGPVCISNAICWSPDNRTMYFADSLKRKVWSYDFDASTGTIENRRDFIQVQEGDGVPDGATVDSEGFVWVAHMRAGQVKRYDPDGRIEREISFPASMTSCPAFGGPDMSTLYVTTASSRFEVEDFEREPDAGSLFAVETDVRGIPEPVFGA